MTERVTLVLMACQLRCNKVRFLSRHGYRHLHNAIDMEAHCVLHVLSVGRELKALVCKVMPHCAYDCKFVYRRAPSLETEQLGSKVLQSRVEATR